MDRVKLRRRRGFTRISSKRQVTIPLAALEQTGLKPGDQLKVDVDSGGRIVLSRPVDVEARRKAIRETSGIFTGVYRAGDLDRLRDEWR
ncbi:MAG TPA: AbrB/MazE/SpoVT family DNA-binding domain-containing protein [Gaiellaceae bacterium]|nr:AbrB/MazE/SpoVT family DNA-binding domain-containing protein [Gaiellaceae bacterium]